MSLVDTAIIVIWESVLTPSVAVAVVPRDEGEAGPALLLRGVDAAASSSGAKLSDRIRAYSWFVKSFRSTSSASPRDSRVRKRKRKRNKGVRGTKKKV
jgi:hypothetical protein